jgi:hypothetical protein
MTRMYLLTEAQHAQIIEALTTRDLRLHEKCEAMLKAMQPDEINFYARCGKLQGDYIHTCTPPRRATRDEKISKPGVYEVKEGKV